MPTWVWHRPLEQQSDAILRAVMRVCRSCGPAFDRYELLPWPPVRKSSIAEETPLAPIAKEIPLAPGAQVKTTADHRRGEKDCAATGHEPLALPL